MDDKLTKNLNTKIILPSHYLPNLVYIKYLLHANEIIIEKHQNYVKQTYSSRCHILGANGIQILTIPIVKIHNQKQPFFEVKINYEENWQKQHWLAFQSAYGKSAFWFYYKDYFENFYIQNKYQYLLEFNTNLLQLIIKLLKENRQFSFTQNYELTYNNATDLREYFDAKNRNKNEINESENLPTYLQVFAEKFPFQPNLSIIDLLMNNGPQSKYLFEK